MAILKSELKFNNEFRGELIAPNGRVEIGAVEGTVKPYDMLFGALASCFYATFLSVSKKKRLSYDSVDIIVTGEKREEVPTTLKFVNLKLVVNNGDNEKGLTKAAELGASYCSIYQTISQVAEMKLEVEFK